MELNRRDFLKGSLAFGGVAALGGLAGCAAPQQASDGQAKDAEPEKKSVPESFTDGKWIGTAMGHDDNLLVQVTVAGGDIAGISVLRCDDTIGIGSTAAPMMAAKILEAKNLDVDTVTGATTTSMAVQSAVADAITNAGGNLPRLPLGRHDPQRRHRTDRRRGCGVHGRGHCGSLRRRACWKPKKTVVVLFEKVTFAGGSMPMTHSLSPPPNRSCRRTTRSAALMTTPCTTRRACQRLRRSNYPRERPLDLRHVPRRPCTGTRGSLWTDARHRRGL